MLDSVSCYKNTKIRMTILLFPYVCPLMPSCNTYHLTCVSLTLDVGYLFMAAPAKHTRFFLLLDHQKSKRVPEKHLFLLY